MALGTQICTWFNGAWHDGDVAVMRAADHGSWLGSTVFDGARWHNGRAPDLDKHLERVNNSARALMLTPTMSVSEMTDIVMEGVKRISGPLYIRPMYWGIDGGTLGIAPSPEKTGFALCLEAVPMPPQDATTTLTTTRFRRPTLDCALTNAKAGCLYPNNARMLVEANRKGFGNALVLDSHGNVAESATANVFMVRDGVVMTPIANGTFLAGITRARHLSNLRQAGYDVRECVLTLDDFRQADEVFLTGNLTKITPVTAFDDRVYPVGPVARHARDLYWDWAASNG